MRAEVSADMDRTALHEQLSFYLRDIELSGDGLAVQGVLREDFPGFEGHFPGHPLLAGAFQVQMLGLMACALGGEGWQVLEVKLAKFRRMLGPGDRLDLRVALDGTDVRGTIETGGARACQATLVIGPAPR